MTVKVTTNARVIASRLVAADDSRRTAMGRALGELAILTSEAYRHRGIIGGQAGVPKKKSLKGMPKVRPGELPPGPAPNFSKTRPVSRTGSLYRGAEITGARDETDYRMVSGQDLSAEVSGGVVGKMKLTITGSGKLAALDWRPALGRYAPRRAFSRQWSLAWRALRRQILSTAGTITPGKPAKKVRRPSVRAV